MILKFLWLFFMITFPEQLCLIAGIIVLIEKKLGLIDED